MGDRCLEQLEGLPPGIPIFRGKVRDIIDVGDRLLITTTDRISAFDRVLTTIPHKGEILNRISCSWFSQVSDLVPVHILEELSPRTVVVRKTRVLPLEVVVRGYLTGSAYRAYQEGKPVSGIHLPKGMKKNEPFPRPLITPSTKESVGIHDEPISEEEILHRKILSPSLWEQVKDKALAVFRRGTEIARKRGLILVDTKYEFGLSEDGTLYLVDELHTPDSSRYWYLSSYEEAFASGKDPRQLDKEYFRAWLLSKGFQGNGPAPSIPVEVRRAVSERYIEAFEAIEGVPFYPLAENPEAETQIVLSYLERFR
ncbi:MAG: phosphoribosylaminoimidazolesuccinocarboxamide synthase [Spirochaetes bacterium]|nr:phosphoribosylaminoimidazolesuccinocarboxamide synthase [Spirochaetota bacterium]